MQRQGNAITIQTFDAVGEDQVKVVSRSTTVDAPGVQSPLSAAFQTILTSQVGAYFYVWAEEAPTSAIYSRGLRMEGVAALVSDSINYNPADVTRNDLSLQFTEGLTIIQPTLAP
jgi:hypothetical protein